MTTETAAREHVWPFVDQMIRALDAELYFASLALALTLPDIASALSDPGGKTSASKHVAWIQDWMGYDADSAKRVYRFRCRFLHEGSFATEGDKKVRPARVLIIEPAPGRRGWHGPQSTLRSTVTGDDYMPLSLPAYVQEVADAVDRWLREHGGSGIVQRNLPKFVQRYPNGFPSIIDGPPVFA